MNEVSIFDFGDSPIRTLTINNKPYFVARDICLALGYVKPENAVKQHCRATLRLPAYKFFGRYVCLVQSSIPEQNEWHVVVCAKH